MKFKVIVATLALSIVCGVALSGEETAVSDDHRKAVEELFKVMKMEDSHGKSITAMVELQARQNPMIAQYKDVMLKFFSKHMSWEKIKDDMIKVYAGEFTVAEIKELTAFYKTPLGAKLASKMPVLTNKAAEVGMKRVQQNMAELQQMIMAEMQNNQPTQ